MSADEFDERLKKLEQRMAQLTEKINRLIDEMREGYNRLDRISELTNSLIDKVDAALSAGQSAVDRYRAAR